MKYSVYHYTRRYMRSTKIRILAAFMAVLILSLSFTHLLGSLNWRLRADAATISSVTKQGEFQIKYTVDSTEHDGHSVLKENAFSNKFTYRYTGTVKPAKVTLYDYKTDDEIGGGNISNTYTNYGSEPFKQLNDAISQSLPSTPTIQSQASNNITIVFDGTGFSSNEDIYVYFWSGSGDSKQETPWPGKKMRKVSGSYVYTLSTTNSDYVGFTPTKLIFNNNGSTQTYNIKHTMSAGNTYTFTGSTNKEVLMLENEAENNTTTTYNVYAYSNSNSNNKNGDWPGVGMTYHGEGYYSYTVDSQYDRIIINNHPDHWQTPGTEQPGLELASGQTYFYRKGDTTKTTYNTTIDVVETPGS